jgi:hypothetical protein
VRPSQLRSGSGESPFTDTQQGKAFEYSPTTVDIHRQIIAKYGNSNANGNIANPTSEVGLDPGEALPIEFAPKDDVSRTEADADRRDEIELDELAGNSRAEFEEPSAAQRRVERDEIVQQLQLQRELTTVTKRGRVDGDNARRGHNSRSRSKSRNVPAASTAFPEVDRSGNTRKTAAKQSKNGDAAQNAGRGRQQQNVGAASGRSGASNGRVVGEKYRTSRPRIVESNMTFTMTPTYASNKTQDRTGEGKVKSAVDKATAKSNSRKYYVVKDKSRNRSNRTQGGDDLGRVSLVPDPVSYGVFAVNGSRKGEGGLPTRTKQKSATAKTSSRTNKYRGGSVEASKPIAKPPAAVSGNAKTDNGTNSRPSGAGRDTSKGRSVKTLAAKTVNVAATGRQPKQPEPRVFVKTTVSPRPNGNSVSGQLAAVKSSSIDKQNSKLKPAAGSVGSGAAPVGGESSKTVNGKTTSNGRKTAVGVSTARKPTKTKLKLKSPKMSGNNIQSDASWNRSSDLGSGGGHQANPATIDASQPSTCEQLKCSAGGLCVDGGDESSFAVEKEAISQRRQAKCRCQLGTAGKYCEQGWDSDVSVIFIFIIVSLS